MNLVWEISLFVLAVASTPLVEFSQDLQDQYNHTWNQFKAFSDSFANEQKSKLAKKRKLSPQESQFFDFMNLQLYPYVKDYSNMAESVTRLHNLETLVVRTVDVEDRRKAMALLLGYCEAFVDRILLVLTSIENFCTAEVVIGLSNTLTPLISVLSESKAQWTQMQTRLNKDLHPKFRSEFKLDVALDHTGLITITEIL